MALPRELLDVYLFPESIFLSLGNKKKSQGIMSGELGGWFKTFTFSEAKKDLTTSHL